MKKEMIFHVLLFKLPVILLIFSFSVFLSEKIF